MKRLLLVLAFLGLAYGCKKDNTSEACSPYELENVVGADNGERIRLDIFRCYDLTGDTLYFECLDKSKSSEITFKKEIFPDTMYFSLYVDTTVYLYCNPREFRIFYYGKEGLGYVIELTFLYTSSLDTSFVGIYCEGKECRFDRFDSTYSLVAEAGMVGDTFVLRGNSFYVSEYTGGYLAPLPPYDYDSLYTSRDTTDTLVYWYDVDKNGNYSLYDRGGDAFGLIIRVKDTLKIFSTFIPGFRGVSYF
ncbi:MAG: hypothetical protein ABIL16_07675 [candidate division WOR-3 bacterium]